MTSPLCGCGQPLAKAWQIFVPSPFPFAPFALEFDHYLVSCGNGCEPVKYDFLPSNCVIVDGNPSKAESNH